MSNKVVVINSCAHCPYYDHYYYTEENTCTLLNKVIIFGEPFTNQIFDIKTDVYGTPPEECPLQSTSDLLINGEKITRKL